MPSVKVLGKTIDCKPGANLRQVLLKHDIPLYNGKAKIINCRGIGSCGTCAVAIEGKDATPPSKGGACVVRNVSPANWKDKTRRSLPPHSLDRDLRLACQTKVLGDISVTKYNGFWGQGEEVVWSG